MKKNVVVGLQWGDEGKGKIIDAICENHDIVTRFQGGNNAGHTIVLNGKVYKLSHIPSGILYPNKTSILGPGMVIELEALFKEIDQLKEEGVAITPNNLKIADNTSILIPLYKQIDKVLEELRGDNFIGTTAKGIGIAYQDRVARRGIRVCDLYEPEILNLFLTEIITFYTPLFEKNNLAIPSVQEIAKTLKPLSERLKPFIINAYNYFDINNTKSILFEGAQGLMLDILWGTYPFVTSSQTHSSQLFSGSGVGFCKIDNIIGVVKAYTTRVGSGPFPTESLSNFGNDLQTKGNEFGTVTGRRRRCGALDLIALKLATKLSGVNSLALTKLDVLDHFTEIPICVAYESDGRQIDYFPSSCLAQKNIKPIYKIFKGWHTPISAIKTADALPQETKEYIKFIEEFLKIPVDIISVGADRNETIYKRNF